MMNALINFSKIIVIVAKINNNYKILIKNVILKFFHDFFRHFELLVVDRKIQISEKHCIDEFLNNKNQIKIQM